MANSAGYHAHYRELDETYYREGNGMFILYFYEEHHEYYHGTFYRSWMGYSAFRPGESHWLVPGTDPEDPDYGVHE